MTKEKVYYLTEKERKMSQRGRLLQYVLGIQSCKTKGDVAELLKEIEDLAIKKASAETRKNLIKKLGKTTFIEHLTELQQKELICFIKNT